MTSERVARLCGEHLEHAYEALRLTTHGIACVSCCYHQDLPNTIICSTSSNCIALYDAARILCISQQAKGPRRCSSAFNPSLSHVAVYGDPMAPAIELQLCTSGKFAFLEGHTAEGKTAVNTSFTPANGAERPNSNDACFPVSSAVCTGRSEVSMGDCVKNGNCSCSH